MNSFIFKISLLIEDKISKKNLFKKKKELIKEKKNNKFDSINSLIHLKNEVIINRNNVLTLNETTNNNKVNKNKRKKKKMNKNKSKKNEEQKDKSLNDYEMNSLDYYKALIYDRRSFFGYYFSLIRTKHIIVFTFFNKKDFNSRPIKITLFSLSLALFYSINALFFTDSTMHKIYIDHGMYDIFYQMPQILYSTIISTIIDSIISYLSLTEESISELRQKESKLEINEKKKFINCIKTKLIIFFILNFLFFVFMWYYLSTFYSVYKNTQIFLLKDLFIYLFN